MAKARVTPMKQVSLPRLELTAAVVAIKVGVTLRRELKLNEVEHVYCTDSKVVLGYVSNDARRFHVFVAN